MNTPASDSSFTSTTQFTDNLTSRPRYIIFMKRCITTDAISITLKWHEKYSGLVRILSVATGDLASLDFSSLECYLSKIPASLCEAREDVLLKLWNLWI